MRVLCRHGHFAFYPRRAGEVTAFCNYFRVELIRLEDFYTFPVLAQAPRYSLAGKSYLNATAKKTAEGPNPWTIMQANDLVYHINDGLLVPKTNIAIRIDPPIVGEFFLAQSPLIQAGSILSDGRRVLSYEGEYVEHFFQLQVSEFSV